MQGDERVEVRVVDPAGRPLTLWSGPCTVSKASITHTLCARLVAVERPRGGEACDEEVLSLLALLVQKYEY